MCIPWSRWALRGHAAVCVQATLRHAVEALMLEENSAVPGLQPAVGRLANALVAVLGPELTLGSPAYCSCRALIREMQVGCLNSHCRLLGMVLSGMQSCVDQKVCALEAGDVGTRLVT